MEEIERKYLVFDIPESVKDEDVEGTHFVQGYVLPESGSQVRLRKIKDQDDLGMLTIKKGSGAIRKEYEIALGEEQFEQLWIATRENRLKKVRYKIGYGEHLIELDVYKGELEGLILAEVEFSSEDEMEEFIEPDWFVFDVTEESAFKNKSLAVSGVPISYSQYREEYESGSLVDNLK